MKRLLLIFVVAALSIALGYFVMSLFPREGAVSDLPQPASNLDKETEQMVRFMNPAITEAAAKKYLAELKKLNVRYGYTPGGSPKGDMETMQAYAKEVAVLQESLSITPQNGREGIGSAGTPKLAPAVVDIHYIPPAGPSDSGVSTSSPALQQVNTPVATGPAAANPNSAAAKGGAVFNPPLIEQEVPPAPPLPPQMSSE